MSTIGNRSIWIMRICVSNNVYSDRLNFEITRRFVINGNYVLKCKTVRRFKYFSLVLFDRSNRFNPSIEIELGLRTPF